MTDGGFTIFVRIFFGSTKSATYNRTEGFGVPG